MDRPAALRPAMTEEPADWPEGGNAMSDRFAGKVALVLGAGSVGPGWGNGKATAVLLAREGAFVFGVDRSAPALAETAEIIAGQGGRFAGRPGDVTRAEE